MIHVHELNLLYNHRGVAGLSQISFNVKRGEIFALIGPNGSGKSTLLNVINGQIPPQSGSCSIQGTVGLFKNESIPTDQTLQEWLMDIIQIEDDPEKKVQMIREFAQTFELTFQLKQPLSQLSSGQLQKAFLIKGLINRPDIFIMDEPFSHLDPHTRQDILKDLFWFLKNKETTILWASHDKEEVFKFADKIGILQHGRFEQIDSALNLNKNPNNLFVAKYLGYKNFFPVKNSSEGFQSIWGITPYDLKWDEAFLVVPEKSWKIDSNGINFKIEHYQILGSHVELELLSGDKIYYIHLPIHLPMPKVSSLIKLSPKWEECFLIPL